VCCAMPSHFLAVKVARINKINLKAVRSIANKV
jgi:hypothetical protein